MDKKRLTPKQIFRTLAFHYHYVDKIPLQVICEMVSAIYYPKDPTGQAQKRYKSLLGMLMKEYTNGQKSISQEQFIDYMRLMSKQKNEQYSSKLTQRIFERYSIIDSDSKERVLCLSQFKQIAKLLKIRDDQVGEYFKNVSDRKNQITFDMFNEYMNGVLSTDTKTEE